MHWLPLVVLALSFFLGVLRILLPWIVGSWIHRRSWRELREAEGRLAAGPETSLRSVALPAVPAEVRLVTGNFAISPGNFRRWTAGIKSWFGGELRGYTDYVELARRHALLRMKQVFPEAQVFLNCKVETAFVEDPRGRGILCIEVSATSTAVRY